MYVLRVKHTNNPSQNSRSSPNFILYESNFILNEARGSVVPAPLSDWSSLRFLLSTYSNMRKTRAVHYGLAISVCPLKFSRACSLQPPNQSANILLRTEGRSFSLFPKSLLPGTRYKYHFSAAACSGLIPSFVFLLFCLLSYFFLVKMLSAATKSKVIQKVIFAG